MKIRTDFVTNLCGSSFILNRQLELTERQKEAVLCFVGDKLSGGNILSEKKGVEHFKKEQGADEEEKEDMGRNFNGEENICQEEADFGEKDFALGELYCRLWNVIEKAGGGNSDCRSEKEVRDCGD